MSKGLTMVSTLSKVLVIIFSITLLVLGLFLGIKYKSSLNMLKGKTVIPSTVITESNCAGIGERSVSNFDMTTGKINPNIKVKNCCSGLKNIADKQRTINKNQGMCAISEGVPYNLCSPCGNGVCDTQYEDYCNCPDDCN